jgi:hypothetical protein
MTEEQRERLEAHARFICSYTSMSDDMRATADAIDAALKRIEVLEGALLVARDRLWSFGRYDDPDLPNTPQRYGNEADAALEGRD